MGETGTAVAGHDYPFNLVGPCVMHEFFSATLFPICTASTR